jgi:hypothetical protein
LKLVQELEDPLEGHSISLKKLVPLLLDHRGLLIVIV